MFQQTKVYFTLWLISVGLISTVTVMITAVDNPDYKMSPSAQFCFEKTKPHFDHFTICNALSLLSTFYVMLQTYFESLICDLLPLFFVLTFNVGFDEVNNELKNMYFKKEASFYKHSMIIQAGSIIDGPTHLQKYETRKESGISYFENLNGFF